MSHVKEHWFLSMLQYSLVQAVNLLHMSKNNVTQNIQFFSKPLPKPITVKRSLSNLWILLQASWQVKREGYKGRTSEVKWQTKWERSKRMTSERNILINYWICNNKAGRSGNSRGNNSFRYRVNLGLWRLRITKENNGPCLSAKQIILMLSCSIFPN